MARIVVTDPLPEAALAELRRRGHEVVACAPGDPAVAHAEAWLVRSATRLDAAALARAPRLRAVGRAGVGTDNVDLTAATARGIAVFHAPTGNVASAAEQTWALLLAAARRVPEADRAMKAGRWDRSLHGVELAGKTLLVVGLGRIGRMVAARAQAFGLHVLAHDPFVAPEQAQAAGAAWVPLDEGLARADVVTLHAALTPESHGLLDARRLALLKPGAILVNVARGGLVDAGALLAALDAGRLRAAALDVWPEEPPTDWRLARHPRVVAAPHLGASTEEAQAKAAREACQRVADFLATGDASLAVNAQVAVPPALRPWAGLTEAMAAFAVQLLDAPPEGIVVGADPALDLEPLCLHALVGGLRAGTEEPVNAINAAGLARERGWSVATRPLPAAEPSYVRLDVRGGAGGGAAASIEGTVTPHYGARVTRLDGYEVEFRPAGRFLVTRHDDVPGVLAAVLGVLAQAGVNVANLSLARDRAPGSGAGGAASQAAGQAVAVIQVDGAVPKAARDALHALRHVRAAHAVRLP